MKYFFSKIIKEGTFEEVIKRTTEVLKHESFGVLTNIDMKATLKSKLNVNIEKYEILGACSPAFAYKALQIEDKIGLMLPCNLIVQQKGEVIEVSAVDPAISMQGIENKSLESIAGEVRSKLKKVIEEI